MQATPHEIYYIGSPFLQVSVNTKTPSTRHTYLSMHNRLVIVCVIYFVKLESRKGSRGLERNQPEVKLKNVIWWRLFRLLKQMPYGIVNAPNVIPRVVLSEPGGSSAEVLLYGGQVVSWKNEQGEELLFTSCKAIGKFPTRITGGISLCSPLLGDSWPHEQPGSARCTLWSLDDNPSNLAPISNQSFVNLILKTTANGQKLWPYSFELRVQISLSRGKLTFAISVRNTDNKSISFKFAVCNYLSISDISEVRVEGLETLDYLDNLLQRERFTEQADAITFDNEVHRIYLSTPPDIAIIDHQKKRTIVLHKEGFPDAALWNPWEKTSKALPAFGDKAYEVMLAVDSTVFDKPIVLKPFQEWKASQKLSLVSSSYCSGQLDPGKFLPSLC